MCHLSTSVKQNILFVNVRRFRLAITGHLKANDPIQCFSIPELNIAWI